MHFDVCASGNGWSRGRAIGSISRNWNVWLSPIFDEAHSGEITQWIAWPKNYANSSTLFEKTNPIFSRQCGSGRFL